MVDEDESDFNVSVSDVFEEDVDEVRFTLSEEDSIGSVAYYQDYSTVDDKEEQQ